MSDFLIICTYILSFILIYSIIAIILKDFHEFFLISGIIGFILTFIVSLIIYVAIGLKSTNLKSFEKMYVKDVVKSKENVYVEFSDGTNITYDTKKMYDLVDSTTKFVKFITYNHYKSEVDSDIILYDENKYIIDKYGYDSIIKQE